MSDGYSYHSPHYAPPKKPKKILKNILFYLFLLGVGLPILILVLLRWVNPPITSFMLQSVLFDDAKLIYQWQDYDSINKKMALAIIASEDQHFAEHEGFDWGAIKKARIYNQQMQARGSTRRRGASTLSQQVTKNLFLWSGQSYIRKGLEVYLTFLLEFIVPKRRILEIYLNIAQFGKGIFGAEAAAQTFFHRSATNLNPRQSALLAAVLPAPTQWDVNNPNKIVRKRQAWIVQQMRQLGGAPLNQVEDHR